MSALAFTGVPAAEVDALWPGVAAHFEGVAARSRGRFSGQDWRQSFLDRSRQLWVAHAPAGAGIGEVRAVLATELRRYPGRRVAALVACSGAGREDWTGFLPLVEAWARAEGCAAIEAEARPGWRRVLAPHGYAATHVILEKELDHAGR